VEKIGGVLVARWSQNFIDYFRVSEVGELRVLYSDPRSHEV
jgi:hypothetical protein